MANYTFKETKSITKKISGVYDSANHTVLVDGSEKDILPEFECFDGLEIELVLRIKEETDLTED